MSSDSEYEALRERYLRLRQAAEKVIDAADYALDGDDEARVYATQLRDLERELRGEPQPHGLAWMSVS
jgi:hypothetical protein